jgi:hypothetical protein
MAAVLKVLGAEVSLGSANNVGGYPLVRVMNTGARAVLNIAYANSTVYANVTVSNTESIVVQKGPTDLLTGANMLGTPIAFGN